MLCSNEGPSDSLRSSSVRHAVELEITCTLGPVEAIRMTTFEHPGDVMLNTLIASTETRILNGMPSRT